MVQIQLDGPAKNALGTQTMTWIRDQLREADGQPVLLTGTGDAFSAGLNLKELASLDAEGMRGFLSALEEMVHDLFHYPAPTVAAVNGHAIAGGCVLSLCCDVRVMTTASKARIGLNEVALGLRFPPRTFQMVQYRLAQPAAEEILMGAGLYGPEDALRLGLVDALADDVIPVATARLEILARHPAGAYRAAKEMLRGHLGRSNDAVDRQFVEEVLPVWTSPELKARIDAFLGRK